MERKKPRPIWEDLPRHLKIYIAKHLGDKSRRSLGLCSKLDHNVVESIPFNMKSVEIGYELFNGQEGLSTVFETSEYRKQSDFVPSSLAISNFINIIKHPKSRIDSMVFTLNNLNTELFAILLEELKTRNLKIRAKRVVLRENSSVLLDKSHLDLLLAADPKVLDSIEIMSKVDDTFLNQLMKTEQWRSANGVHMSIKDCEHVKIEDFFHFEQLSLQCFKGLNGESQRKIIEKRNLPVDSFFVVSNRPTTFAMSKNERENEQVFDMPNGNKLHVEYNQNMFQGRVINELGKSRLTFDQLLYRFHSGSAILDIIIGGHSD